MDTITLVIAQLAGRGTRRTQRQIVGHTLKPRRPIYVKEGGTETLIISSDQETIMATGRDLYEAAQELAEIHRTTVRLLDHTGRQMWIVGADVRQLIS